MGKWVTLGLGPNETAVTLRDFRGVPLAEGEVVYFSLEVVGEHGGYPLWRSPLSSKQGCSRKSWEEDVVWEDELLT